MAATQFIMRILCALMVVASATRGLRTRDGAPNEHSDSLAKLAEATEGAKSKLSASMLQTREADVDDDDQDGAEDQETADEDNEVQEVARTAQQGPFQDATHLMLEGSNAMLASAKAAAADA
mmetsp:Transcript_11284/g.30736  ORF Transcript_11284/g.30736 Transcript_11284/m.30736 type:complete len:122 (-) Transcript_11284:39-404(-)